ncbi:terminase small subunit [Neisseria sp. Ec49-e6-T10]|uniref:terminase small subunit n=1 Tax=Neisseria sp. Ec49-e6-T10 TaxID=3140744 RepID=UPI003EBD13AE
MAAPKGNKFWEARSSHGRNPKFSSPDDLWEACTEYFTWVEENPLYEIRPFAYQGEVTQEPVPKMRAMTISGLCIFLDISVDTWANYRSNKDFLVVTSRVEEIIYNQKFSGAAADMLTLLRLLNQGDYKGAANQFPRWNKAKGKVLAGLTRRRAAEKQLFESKL